MQVNIFCHTTSIRLEYTLDFIFNEVLGCGYKLLHDLETDVEGPTIVYGEKKIAGFYHIKSEGLLFEENVRQEPPSVIGEGEMAILFPGESDHSFDVFSATFFLISRYEEYLPFTKDLYLRFPHTLSLAFRHKFLNFPLVDKWIRQLAEKLYNLFPGFQLQSPKFKWIATYDIDMAWSYLHKGILRNMGGFIKSPGLSRVLTLAHIRPDPFDSFKFLDELHGRFRLNAIYFWLLPKKRGKLDRNISPQNPAMRELIKKHKKYSNGIHPSWFAKDDRVAIRDELKTLEEILDREVSLSRQHYLRFTLPETYTVLAETGITDEYSMGYGTTNGFRASTSNPFFWFNLTNNQKTAMKVHPFCFMDANSFYEHRLSANEAWQELLRFKNVCEETGGNLVTIFHNNFLGTDPRYKGWREMYIRFIQEVLS